MTQGQLEDREREREREGGGISIDYIDTFHDTLSEFIYIYIYGFTYGYSIYCYKFSSLVLLFSTVEVQISVVEEGSCSLFPSPTIN